MVWLVLIFARYFDTIDNNKYDVTIQIPALQHGNFHNKKGVIQYKIN